MTPARSPRSRAARLAATGTAAALALGLTGALPAFAEQPTADTTPTAQPSAPVDPADTTTPANGDTDGPQTSGGDATAPGDSTDTPTDATATPDGTSAQTPEQVTPKTLPQRTAANFVVTSGADSGPGSLRDAIALANDTAGPQNITFAPELREIVVSSPLTSTDDLTITGRAVDGHLFPSLRAVEWNTDEGDPADALINSRLSSLTLRNLELFADDTAVGGVLSHELPAAGTLTVDRVSVHDAFGYGVGVLQAAGSVMITDSTIDNSTENTVAHGIAEQLSPEAKFVVSGSRITGNTGTGLLSIGSAGAQEGHITVRNSVFEGNGSIGAGPIASGGAITVIAGDVPSDMLRVENSTFTNNIGWEVGGISVPAYASGQGPGATIVGSTFSGNSGTLASDLAVFAPAAFSALTSKLEGDDLSDLSTASEALSEAHPDQSDSPQASASFRASDTRPVAFRVSNSTFAGEGTEPSTAITMRNNFSATELDQVTFLNSKLSVLPWVNEPVYSLRNTVIDSGDDAPISRPAEPNFAAAAPVRDQLATATNSAFTAPSDAVTGTGNVFVAGSAALKLGALADNGGSTLTALPAQDSPLIDAGAAVPSGSVDQRGVARPQGKAPDIGSVELVQKPVDGGPDTQPGTNPKPVDTHTPKVSKSGAAHLSQTGANFAPILGIAAALAIAGAAAIGTRLLRRRSAE